MRQIAETNCQASDANFEFEFRRDYPPTINHPQETGFRRDNVGRAIPRDIITRFTCTYAGEEVFRMDLFTGVAANPFVAFTTIATETGDLVFEWTDQHGAVTKEQARITVA